MVPQKAGNAVTSELFYWKLFLIQKHSVVMHADEIHK